MALAAMVTLHRLGLEDVGVVVCQNRIASLEELDADLERYGVPLDRVSLVHSDLDADRPPRHATPEDARQHVLLTHANVLDRHRLRGFSEWKGRKRLVVWDESLFSRTSYSVDLVKLMGAAGELKVKCKDPEHTDLAPVAEYLTCCATEALATLEELRRDGLDSMPLRFPPRSFALITSMREVLAVERTPSAVARDFLEMCQEEVRVLPQSSGGIISYRDTVSRDLAPDMLVLDASYVCRDVLKMDTSLVDAATLPHVEAIMQGQPLSELKSYAAVEVMQVLSSGGRDAIVRKDLAGRGAAPVLKLVADAVASSTVPVLVYCFKPRSEDGADAKQELLAALDARGLAHLETDRVTVAGESRRWLNFQTHGNETGFNRYNHCGLVVLWGVLHVPDTVTAALIAAGEDDLDTDLSKRRVLNLRNSEKHHRVLQALSRGTMRNPAKGEPGAAAAMRALVIDGDRSLCAVMREALPGIQWTRQLGPGQTRGTTELAAEALVTYLAKLPEGTESVPLRQAKGVVRNTTGGKLAPKTWRRARDLALHTAKGWRVEGHRLQRGHTP